MRATPARIAAVADAVVVGSRIIEEIENRRPTTACACQALQRGIDDAWTPRAARGESMSWLNKTAAAEDQAQRDRRRAQVGARRLWSKCPACEAVLYATDLENNLNVCPKCGHHNRLARAPRSTAARCRRALRDRRRSLPVDPAEVQGQQALPERLQDAANEDTGEADALVVMQGAIKTVPVVVACFEFEFMGGSMGSVVGERFVRGVQGGGRAEACPSSASPLRAARACRKACSR
jgi:DNA-directed RNA polymerase subunit M/transcription elongation factor TFIIS